jgi:hypothetical protein
MTQQEFLQIHKAYFADMAFALIRNSSKLKPCREHAIYLSKCAKAFARVRKQLEANNYEYNTKIKRSVASLIGFLQRGVPNVPNTPVEGPRRYQEMVRKTMRQAKEKAKGWPHLDFNTDDYGMTAMYLEDSADLLRIALYLNERSFGRCKRIMWDMDTAARDAIPNGVHWFLHTSA